MKEFSASVDPRGQRKAPFRERSSRMLCSIQPPLRIPGDKHSMDREVIGL